MYLLPTHIFHSLGTVHEMRWTSGSGMCSGIEHIFVAMERGRPRRDRRRFGADFGGPANHVDLGDAE